MHLGGYQSRAKTLRKKILETSEALEKATRTLNSFHILKENEEAVIQTRLEKLKQEAEYVSRRERIAQDLYRERVQELRFSGGEVQKIGI